jgi:type II secretory pathway pseudopilin PulG
MMRDKERSNKYNKCMNLAGQERGVIRRQDGYAMAALLVGISVMSVLMSMALPVWSHMTKREKEEELIWRGNQYVRAIRLFQTKYANTFPPTVDVLVDQKFLRKKYKDPITNDDFLLLPPGQMTMPGASIPGQPGRGNNPQPQQSQQPQRPGTSTSGPQPYRSAIGGSPSTQGGGGLGIGGVASKSKETSIKIYNGRQKYNEWSFIHIQMAQSVGGRGSQNPGMINNPNMPPGRGGNPPFNPGGPGGPMPFNPGRGGGAGPMMPGGRPPVPFNPGQFGQPGQSPFGQPMQPPFGGRGQPPPQRPPGN